MNAPKTGEADDTQNSGQDHIGDREGAPIADDDAISELCGEASAAIVVTKSAASKGSPWKKKS